MPIAREMNGWASLYANLEKSAPALAAAPRRYEKRDRPRRRRDLCHEPSALMVPESDSEVSESDDELELEEEEFYEVLQGSRQDHRSRKYATVTYLSPPKPNLHRRHNPEGMAERQRLRKYESHPMHQGTSQPSDRYKVLPPLPRSISLPEVNIIQDIPGPSSDPAPPSTVSKPRKARPTPLDLVTRFRQPHTPPVDPIPSSPYTPSLLSLYSPHNSTTSSPSRSLSLPLYPVNPLGSSSPERLRMSNPLPASSSTLSTKSTTSSISSTSNSSPRSSNSSLCSSRTSLSSVRTDPELLYTMPAPPTPTAILTTKRDRIYNTLSPIELARRPSKELTYR